MATSPLSLYQQLLSLVEADTERQACTALRRLLRRERADWPPPLRELMDGAGVSVGYVTRHLLSIHRFSDEARHALELGLPLAVCRLVNGLPDERDRAAALEPLLSLERSGRVRAQSDERGGSLSPSKPRASLLPRGVAARVERNARRMRTLEAAATVAAKARIPPTTEGWLQAVADPVLAQRPPGDVWFYPPQSAVARRAEALPAAMAEGLVATYLSPGDRVVDVTAGAGTFGLLARGFGVGSWSADIRPAAPFVHQADARDLMLGATVTRPDNLRRPARHTSQALVLHPPTYSAWLDLQQGAQAKLATLEAYAEEVAAMLSGSLAVLAPGGVVLMITRPVRSHREVSLVTSHLAQVLSDFDLELVGYHMAVSSDGRSDWHALVGRR